MAEIKSFPNNQDEYVGAEYVMKWFHGRTSGVYGAENNCSVKAVEDAMAVTVSDGEGWISNDNADGVVWWIDEEKNTGEKLRLPFDVADGVLDRIDRVIVSWETTNYVARPVISVLKGIISSQPVVPALTNNNIMRQIALARVYIAAGTLSLTDAMITDERLDPSVCGIVTESVSVDTSTINAKVNATLDEVQDEAYSTLEDTRNQATSILESIEQELADLEAGTAVELKKLQFTDTAVPVSAFVSDSTYQDFPYRAEVALTGVISSMIPDVVLGVVDATSGNVCPVAECYNGGVYLYAASPPDAEMTIPTIICWRGNA